MEATTGVTPPSINNSTHDLSNDKNNQNTLQQPIFANHIKTNNKNGTSNNNKRRRPNTPSSSPSSSSDEIECVKQKQLEVSNQMGKIEDKLSQITSMLMGENNMNEQSNLSGDKEDETIESSSEDDYDIEGYTQTLQQ
jgi:hypothetical protein